MKNIRVLYLKVFRFLLEIKFSLYSNRHAFVMDPDQTPQHAAPDQGLHSLQIVQQLFL